MKKKKRRNKSAVKSDNQHTTPQVNLKKKGGIYLAVIASLLYLMSVGFEYAIDDALYITDNTFTKQGIQGIPDLLSKESLYGFFGKQKDLVAGGRYRPLALVSFAIEYEFFGRNPHISHFLNVLLYGFTVFLIYYLMSRLFPDKRQPWYFQIPFIISLLFVVHPIHTEVVSNIKGRVELLGFIGVLGAMIWSIKYIDTNKIKYIIYAAIAFFLALMGKEDSITYLAAIPLTLYFFTKANFSKQLKVVGTLLSVTALFLMIRTGVIGFLFGSGVKITELLNDPFLGASNGEKYATIFYTLGAYLKLLFFPHPLTHDYYPKQISIIGWSDFRAILSFLLYFGMAIFALWGLRRKNVIAYGISLFIIPLSIVSNLVFPIGAFMNERFLYMPSLGFCIVLTYLLVEQVPKWVKNKRTADLVFKILLGIFVFGFAIKTVTRVPDWRNNKTIFLADVQTSTNSTKANTSAGGTLYEMSLEAKNEKEKNDYLDRAEAYLKKAIEIHPKNTSALILMGNVAYGKGNYKGITDALWPLFEINSEHDQAHKNLTIFVNNVKNPNDVNVLVNFHERMIKQLKPFATAPYEQLGVLYAKHKNELAKGIYYLNEALAKSPNKLSILQGLGIAYGMQGDFSKAIQMNEQALKLEPENARLLLNLGITYDQQGNKEKANFYLEKAFELDPSLRK